MPVSRTALLADLKRWVTRFENDLREQCAEDPDLDSRLKGQYDLAKKAGRTALAYKVWRDDELTQSAVAWVLSSVFVRFLEDNDLLEKTWISGLGENRELASQTRSAYFTEHRTHSDHDYLRHVFREVGRLPGMADLMDERHNALWNASISGDAAKEFVEFWRRIDPDTGAPVHAFDDPEWDTRFLGDLYQDLSESARKKYALLQTPDFVEEFILDRTLDPAIDTFGLKEVRMIDPTCGSGHFLIGGFRRLLRLWQKERPDLAERELVLKALDGIHGVDINPFAVAIARFRLLLAAWRFCQVKRLRHAPDFQVNLAVGDSLLHGARFDSQGQPYVIEHQTLFGGEEEAFQDELSHCFKVEDARELHRILGQQYHAVVGNPPYITVKDKALNELYRRRYDACHRKYSLSVPFMERFFDLALAGSGDGRGPAGFTGQITANSFMKREFGKKLIEEFIPKWDLTHVIDTSGAYIPGHGTPTVILFGRNAKPSTTSVRTVMGIKGEPATPDDPAQGKVWSAIIDQVDRPGSESEFVSAADTEREKFHKHPWSIGGGGAAELSTELEEAASSTLSKCVSVIGVFGMTNADDIMLAPKQAFDRNGVEERATKQLVLGDLIRDFQIEQSDFVLFPYEDFDLISIRKLPGLSRWLWQGRTTMGNRATFAKMTYFTEGRPWWEWHQVTLDRLQTPLSIILAFVATHNHFVLDRGGKVFKQSAPVIKLPAKATEDDHLRLLGLLNSAAACFWMKQVFYPKGGDHVGQEGARVRKTLWDERYEFDSTKLKQFPIPAGSPLVLARELDRLAQELSTHSPEALTDRDEVSAATLSRAEASATAIRDRMISLQEELDWQCYRHYGLIDAEDDLEWPEDRLDELPPLTLGERTFEIFMARQMASGVQSTTWFERHKEAGSRPITEPPAHWPEAYLALYFRRHEAIQENKNLNLIERPEFKRRWNTEPWAKRQQEALRKWLLTRLECYFHDADRMVQAADDEARAAKIEALRPIRARFAGGTEPRLASLRQLAGAASSDGPWMEAAEVYTGRHDFNVAKLVEDLVLAESVPALPADRYKAPGLRKRVEWEHTWELQREEDRIDAKFEELERKIEKRIDLVLAERGSDLPARIETKRSQIDKAERDYHAKFGGGREYDPKRPYHAREGTTMDASRGILDLDLRQIARELRSLESELLREQQTIRFKDAEIEPLLEAIDQLPKKPDIPVPPKYGSGDFAKTSYWKLRGKLDVPKERWILYPGAEGGLDDSPVIAWAGWDHAQQAQALAGFYQQAKDTWGWDEKRLAPLLATLKDLLPWLHQWHDAIDPRYRQKLSTIYDQFYQTERQALRMTEGDVEAVRMGG